MTIGEFAQASGLSISALRFYDEKGLLEPYHVDPATGYRRYVAAQVRRAAVIKCSGRWACR
jgi:DNA-binding transcriptional MerR regulator